MAYMGSSPLVLGHLYNLPMRLLAVACRHTGSQAIIARNGATPPPAGPRIGTVLGSDGHVLAHHFAKARGLRSPVYINLSPEECVNALSSGMLDYAALWEPYVSLAEAVGASRVFTDDEVPFSLYGFLVATERAVDEKYKLVEACRQVNDAALESLRRDPASSVKRLRMVFGSAVSTQTYERILTDGYDWEAVDLLNADTIPEAIMAGLQGVRAAHEELQGTTFSDRPIEALIGAAQGDRPRDDTAPLLLGYSNSIMCTTFHVADYEGLFTSHGFDVQSGRRRIEDRIARLDAETQDDFRLCYELLHRDPELVIQKLGHINEQLFRRLSRQLLNTESKSTAAVIEALRESAAIPSDILSWADSVRSIRNVVTHAEQRVTDDQAANVFNIMLDIVEWHLGARDSLASAIARCGRCRAHVESDWVACPNCGASLSGTCRGCDKPVETTWKVCPHCGTSTG